MTEQLKPGTLISHYGIVALIGEGGMGEVYLAEDLQLRRKVALKLLPTQFTADAERVQRFEQEARAASALNHPNILTIHEVGHAGEVRYIATEFIEGQTLRQLLGARLELGTVLDVAIQAASALSAAHAAGIVHRDIKPENIMVRPDRLVKVLDFGLAKLTENYLPAAGNDAPTSAGGATNPGTVLGTAQYMSPEQARGLAVDARTDIFSLGIVIYEMAAGKAPFEGSFAIDALASMLKTEPQPLAQYAPEIPPELHRIVHKALRKNPEERYQVVMDLLIDLKDLKRKLEFEAELEHTIQPDARSGPKAAKSGGQPGLSVTVDAGGEETGRIPAGGGEIISLVRHHKRTLGITLAALVLAAAAILYFMRVPALTEQDAVLLADFVNMTGDAVFDGTLKQALAVHLEQTPFLNFLPEERVRETLRLMSRPAGQSVTREVAREICQRQGLKAMLIGSIASLGNNYVITLEAANGRSGEVIARQQAEAESKEQVLRSLGQAASQLRKKLGESLSSIQRFDTRLEQATTSSLEALKAFSLGWEKSERGKYLEAIPLYRRATELDPNFAMAYSSLSAHYGNTGQPELSAEAADKAFALRGRVTEREKFRIASTYYSNATGELDKAIEALELWKQTYPHDYVPRNSLALNYHVIGQPEKAMEEAREAVRLNPNSAPARSNLAAALFRLNRFDEAKADIEQMLRQKLDTVTSHRLLYAIASFEGDGETMRKQLDWLARNSNEHWALDLQAGTAAMAGQLRQAQSFSRRAVELAAQRNLKGLAASFVVGMMLNEVSCGLCGQTRQDATRALALSRAGLAQASVPVVPGSAFALAVCGEAAEAEKLANELARRYPKATLVNAVYVPVVRAAIELQRGNPEQAVQSLEALTPYEGAAWWWPNHLRGQAYLRLSQGGAAAAEFQKILDHSGLPVWFSTFYPLARLGLARSAALAGDADKSRRAYQDFLAFWKDADAGLPILDEAKKEYGKIEVTPMPIAPRRHAVKTRLALTHGQ